jgi:hypothetical protein
MRRYDAFLSVRHTSGAELYVSSRIGKPSLFEGDS